TAVSGRSLLQRKLGKKWARCQTSSSLRAWCVRAIGISFTTEERTSTFVSRKRTQKNEFFRGRTSGRSNCRDCALILPMIPREFPMSHRTLVVIFLAVVAVSVRTAQLHAQTSPRPTLVDNTQSNKSASPDAIFAEARRLAEQGKY